MSGGGSTTKVFQCPAHTWTNVLWMAGGFFTLTYRVSVPTGTKVLYRRYGSCIPPYMEGSFTTTDTFSLYPWEQYVRVDIRPSGDTPVTATVS